MLAALTAAAAVLLVVSGLTKLRTPAPAAAMVAALTRRRAGLRPVLRPVVRLIAVGEIVVGALVLTIGGRLPAALLATTYLVFVAVALRLLRLGATGTRPSCGCFGRTDAPIGWPHVVLDVAAAAVAVATVYGSNPPLGGLSGRPWPMGLTGGIQIVLLAWLGFLTITALPALAAARRMPEAR